MDSRTELLNRKFEIAGQRTELLSEEFEIAFQRTELLRIHGARHLTTKLHNINRNGR